MVAAPAPSNVALLVVAAIAAGGCATMPDVVRTAVIQIQ